MKKRIIALGVTVLMLSQVLMGCSKAGFGKGETSGKGGDGVLQLAIVAKGYGDEYLKQLASAYEAKTGVKTQVVKSSASDSWVKAQLLAGAELNDVDIYFDIRANAMQDVAVSNYLAGYERAYVDLSEIYDEVPEGYNTDKKLKDLVGDYVLDAVTWDLHGEGFGDGKQYFVSYATGMEGLIYNVSLFEKYNLSVPKTTNEFFALLDQMKKVNNGTYAKNSSGKTIYPYSYSGNVNYSNFITRAWWAQYDGVDTYYNMWKGQDASGRYTVESQKSVGKLSAFGHIARLLDHDSGYTSDTCYDSNFTTAQVLFLDEQSFMMTTGDWLEREMSGNFGDANLNIAFMKIPVNSDIIKKCDSITSEERLVETIAYVDGEVQTRPSYLSDADLARISEARAVYSSEANQHIAYIPAYSNMIDEAKDFFRFMLSKEGQEIMLEYAFGNMVPMNVDVQEFKQYSELSPLQKSKYDLMQQGSGLIYIGQNRSHPMSYVGGVEDFVPPKIDLAFGAVKTSSTYMTPEELWQAHYETFSGKWKDMMIKSGVSN